MPYLRIMFQELTGNGRIWIYTANRKLSADEMADVQQQLNAFCMQWDAHGSQLKAEFHIAYDQILILGVDEDFEAASGCSIDRATAIFKQLDSKYNIDLFNRLNLAFVKEESVRLVKLSEINQAYHSGVIADESEFLDNTISNLSDFRNRWNVSFNNSWAYRKVKKVVQNA